MVDPFLESSETPARDWGLGLDHAGCLIVPQSRRSEVEIPASTRLMGGSTPFSIHLEVDSRGDAISFAPPIGRPTENPVPTRFPAVGEDLGGFRLVGLLGRGSFAHVYLAEELDLANRRVALKVSKPLGDEPQTLAQIQHTNIVPIHSVRDDPVSGLRLLCMPYFGGANLAQVLKTADIKFPSETTGQSLIEVLDRIGGPAEWIGTDRLGHRRCHSDRIAEASPSLLGPSPLTRSVFGRTLTRFARSRSTDLGSTSIREKAEAPARRYLRSHTRVEAAVWIATRLAEGLDHAHSRGFLHRDLKPSNILIAADGTPMLLDFNLSAELGRPKPEDDPTHLGGTLPYMAPEHLEAFNPLSETSAGAIDERSDVYALGLILFEMVAGRHPFSEPEPGARLPDLLRPMIDERRRGAPSARAHNPEVSWGLDSIIRTCLEPNPDRRFASAGDLAEDLRRFLDDRPLKFAPDPCPCEYLAKWSRRHPRAGGVGSIVGLALIAICAVGWAGNQYRERLEAASVRLRFDTFREQFGRCQLLLNSTSGPGDQLERGLSLAEKALAVYQVDRPGFDGPSRPDLRGLSTSERLILREELSELLLLDSRARVKLAARGRSEDRRARALYEAVRRLDLAERIDPRPSAALFDDRARDLAALGEADRAHRDRQRAESTQPSTGRDHYLIGAALLSRGDRDRAEASLVKAVALDSRRFWAWFALGLCHLEQNRFGDSAGDFAACTVIAPEFAWPYLNRGIALARSGRLVEARSAYDRALSLDPKLVEARLNRALALLELGDPSGALDDLNVSIRLGQGDDPAVLAARAEAMSRLGRRDQAEHDFAGLLERRPHDPTILVARGFSRINTDSAAAERDFDRALRIEPRHARAHLGRAILLQRRDPSAALREVDAALDAIPGLLDALSTRALVLARLGKDEALADVDLLLQAPTPHRLYHAARALSLLSASTRDTRHVVRGRGLLTSALKNGLDPELAARDPDLDALRPW